LILGSFLRKHPINIKTWEKVAIYGAINDLPMQGVRISMVPAEFLHRFYGRTFLNTTTGSNAHPKVYHVIVKGNQRQAIFMDAKA
jgi:hypothetical protein